ncbi:MAG TPA: hypothetical protein VIK86_08230 [Candidatus Paceibacterota bacterium]
MKKTKTIFILIFSAITAILSVCLFVFIIKVIENKNTHISAVLSTYQSKLKEKENAVFFKKKTDEIKLLQDSINGYFIDPNKIDTFVNSLEEINLITGADVSVKSIEISQSVKNIISVKLLISGTFEQVVKTISYLENIPYQINITKVYLNKDIKDSTQIKQSIDKTSTLNKVLNMPTWQADVSFNILSLN